MESKEKNEPQDEPSGGMMGVSELMEQLDEIRRHYSSGEPEPKGSWRFIKPHLKQISAHFVAAAIVAILAQYIVPLVGELLPWAAIKAFFARWSGQLLGTAGVLAIGFVLFQLRCRQRAIYGSLEICFATIVCWIAVGQVESQGLAAWIGVMSAAYLVVRGYDNLFEGLKVVKQIQKAPNPATS
jgi:hypothetical protein